MFQKFVILGVSVLGFPSVVYAQAGVASSSLLLHCKSATGGDLILAHLNKSSGRSSSTEVASIFVNASASASIQSANGLAFEQLGEDSKYTYSAAEESYLSKVTLYFQPKISGCGRSGDCAVKISYTAVLSLNNAQNVNFSCTELKSAAVPADL